MADGEGVAKSTVQRWFFVFGVKSHWAHALKLSMDPFFVAKVRDVTPFHLNPPDHAIVLAVDEKTRIPALDRTRPMPSLGLGHAEGKAHDHTLHRTTTLLAALHIAARKVNSHRTNPHRRQERFSLLRLIDREAPSLLDVRIVPDNCAIHKHTKFRARLANKMRIHMHHTPTCASWLKQVGR